MTSTQLGMVLAGLPVPNHAVDELARLVRAADWLETREPGARPPCNLGG